MIDNDYRNGGAVALRKVARLAEEAEKRRTAAWLISCAKLVVTDGFDLDWPEAPAYKGRVVHVDKPIPDLKNLTNDQLIELGIAIDAERHERFERKQQPREESP